MNKKPIKAILFDLGNVIVKVNTRPLEEKWAYSGKKASSEVIDYFMDSDNMNGYMEGKLSSSQFYTKTKRFFNLDMKFHEFYDLWNSVIVPYPEMEVIIKNLKNKYPDIKLILISNINEKHYTFVRENYKILDLLDGFAVSHELGRQKPHHEIYQEAVRLAETLPKHAFYTDDRQDLIDAARTLGIRAFQFTNHETLQSQLSRFGINV
ncbi:MAG: HAD family phosphatase [Candidatus Omnitrophota bacterium]